jgi:DNA-binding IclR family transcriptional regulator
MISVGKCKHTKRTIQKGGLSIHRAVCLLREVVNLNDRGARLTELAEKAGLHLATARRMLKVLASEGLLTYDPVTRLYHLGIDLYYFGAAAHQFKIRDRCRTTLERVAQLSEDTAYLVIRSGYDVLCIDRVEGAFPIRALTHNIGTRVPLGVGAGSLTLLAFSPPEQIERIIHANRLRYLKYNSRTYDYVRAMVAETQKIGYGVSEGNVMPGAVGIGVPIRNHRGEAIAAMSITAVSWRMTQDRRKQIAELLQSEIGTINVEFRDEEFVESSVHTDFPILFEKNK